MTRASAATCEYTVEGNPDGPSLLFIHGWPDDAGLWCRQVEALAGEFRCVLVTLPNFGARPVRSGGFDFGELVAMLAQTIAEVRRGEERFILVTHDWGAYLGYLLEQAHPACFERMVALDIGAHVAPAGARERFFIAGYQWTLILLWLIGGIVPPLGNRLTRGFAATLGVPARQAATARSRCNYPYFYLWRGLLLRRWRRQLLGPYRPRCPVLFLFGARKPVMFHSARWLETVAQTGGRNEAVADGGHWFMETHADVLNRAIRDWAGRPRQAAPDRGAC